MNKTRRCYYLSRNLTVSNIHDVCVIVIVLNLATEARYVWIAKFMTKRTIFILEYIVI